MNRRINLVAVQAKPELKDYRDAASFHRKIADLIAKAVAAIDSSLPTLIAFPEAIGLFLSFVPFHYEKIKDCKTVKEAVFRIASASFSSILRTALKFRNFGLSSYFVATALEAEKIYLDIFSSLAFEKQVYISAGSIYLPRIDEEGSQGRFIADSKVNNVSYLFSPSGCRLMRTPKINLAPRQESGLFQPGSISEILPVETQLGRLGTLICYDGFFESLIERFDALGVEILIKPSYNTRQWNEPWAFDNKITEGEAWMRYGLSNMIQARQNIKYGVNPMMTGKIFDLEAEGVSSISINRNLLMTDNDIVVAASNSYSEEIVAATVYI